MAAKRQNVISFNANLTLPSKYTHKQRWSLTRTKMNQCDMWELSKKGKGTRVVLEHKYLACTSVQTKPVSVMYTNTQWSFYFLFFPCIRFIMHIAKRYNLRKTICTILSICFVLFCLCFFSLLASSSFLSFTWCILIRFLNHHPTDTPTPFGWFVCKLSPFAECCYNNRTMLVRAQ